MQVSNKKQFYDVERFKHQYYKMYINNKQISVFCKLNYGQTSNYTKQSKLIKSSEMENFEFKCISSLFYLLNTQEKDIFQGIKQKIQIIHLLQKKLFQFVYQLELDNLFDLDLTRNLIEDIFKKQLSIVSLQDISFENSFKHQNFWKIKENSAIDIEDANLIIGRDMNKIQKVDTRKGKLFQLLEIKNSLLLKMNRKLMTTFIQLNDDQTIIDHDNIQKESAIIQLIFKISSSKTKNQILASTTELIQQISFKYNSIIHLILKKFSQIIYKQNTIIIQNKPILALILTSMINHYKQENSFYRQLFNTIQILNYPTKFFFFRSNQIFYTNVLNQLKQEFKEKVEDKSISIQDVLKFFKLKDNQINHIKKLVQIEGIHRSSNNRYIINVNKQLKYYYIIFIENEPSKKVDFFNDTKEQNFIGFGESLKLTIKNEYLPYKYFSIKKSVKINKTQHMKHPFKIREINFHQNQIAENLNQVQFDVLKYNLDTLCNLAYRLITEKFVDLKLNNTKFQTFLKKTLYYYEKNNNPFHNMYHAFSVMHGAYIMSKSEIFNQLFDNYTKFTFIISALCHDLSHTGYNNAFQQKTQSKLANRYGDRSILQNYSISKALKMFSFQDSNFIQEFSQKAWRQFRKLLVSSILATDNKNHMIVLSQFDNYLKKQQDVLDFQTTETIIGCLLHGCDFWGNVKPFKTSYNWTKRVNEQFQKQYTKQIQLQIEATPYFKNLTDLRTMVNNEMFFISAIVEPLYKTINIWCKGYLQQALKRIDQNKLIWKQVCQTQEISKYI